MRVSYWCKRTRRAKAEGVFVETDHPEEAGDEAAVVFARLYDSLHDLARRISSRERSGHTLQPTALLHEAFVRLNSGAELRWRDDHHFQMLVAQSMRRTLIDHSRRRHRRPEGHAEAWTDAADPDLERAGWRRDVQDLHDALDLLPRRFRDGEYYRKLILWHLIFGLSQVEVAAVLGCTDRTVRTHLELARQKLREVLERV
jgi:RNA polymerase sigma factor (TIGR02999 family)